MILSRSRRRIAVWLTLAALLFSAVSPVMASVLFAGRPDILARVLALPAKSSAKFQADICHQDASGAQRIRKAGSPSDDDADHAAHGIYCSFCLAASSLATVPAAAPAVVFGLACADTLLSAVRVQPPLAVLSPTRHPRDPPFAVR